MMDLAIEKKHLAQANRDIAEGEVRVQQQADLVQRLRTGAHDTLEAERLLLTLKQTLATWCSHRDNILATISQIEDDGLGGALLPKPLS